MARSSDVTAASGVALAPPNNIWGSLSWIVRGILALSFLTAFLQYDFPFALLQFFPLASLGLCGVLILSGRRRNQRIQHILSGGALWFTAVLFGEAVSYTSNDTYSILYGLVFVGVFFCARLIVQEIGVPNVMVAYSQAGMVTAVVSFVLGRRGLLADQTTRFAGGSRAHPNLVAFVLAGFFPAVVWRAIEEKSPWKRRGLIVLCLINFDLVFLTGSRGSLAAVLVAGLFLLIRGWMGGWLQRFRISHLHIIVIVFFIPLLAILVLQNHRIERFGEFLNDFLALSTSQRGIKSGLSGRTDIWRVAFAILRSQNRWLFGFGYRAGDRLVGTIDNGYVQLLFESGLIAGGLIFGSMLRVFYLLTRASNQRENNAWTRYYSMLWCLMIVYLLNNISARYLFSFGSPFSLCVLCLMAASREELIGDRATARVAKKAQPPPRAKQETLGWQR